MSKLSRIIQRVFGETGTNAEFGQFGSEAASPPGATTKDLTVIQSLSQYLLGWYSATANASEPPRIQDRNALDLLITSQLKYLFQAGIPEWLDDADQRYYTDVSFVNRSGVIYIAILGDDAGDINTGKDPLTEPTWWTPLLEALEDAIDLNTTHRGSDGKNHSDVVLNTTHRGSNGSDHGFIDQDVKVASGPTFNGGVQTDGTKLRTKVIDIGDWNMNADGSVDILHELDPTKIRSLTVIIRHDTQPNFAVFNSFTVGGAESLDQRITIDNNSILLVRDTDGFFDNTSYENTSFNRGWITIIYEV